jgi:hypothetical protein
MYTVNEVDYLIQKAYSAGFNEGVERVKMFSIRDMIARGQAKYTRVMAKDKGLGYLPSELQPLLKHSDDIYPNTMHKALRGVKKKKGYKIGQGDMYDDIAFMGAFH